MLIITVGFFEYLIYKKGNHAAEPRGVERASIARRQCARASRW